MSMAEDTRKRPEFSSDHSSNAPRESGNDPLAELARLIGQSDPFTDGAKRGAQKPSLSTGPAPEWLARPASAEHEDYEAPPAPRAAYVPPAHEQYDPPAEPAAAYRPASSYADQGHDDRYAAQDAHAYQARAYQAQDAAHYPADDQHQYENDGRYGVARPTGDYEVDDYDGGHLPPHGDDGVLPARKRNWMMMIAAVLGLAVIGTAGAFGYRAFTSPGSGGSANPPVIKADTTPAKTVPAAPAPAQSADNKPFQERIGAPGATATKLGPTEEQPVSLPVPPAPSRTTSLPPSATSAGPLVMPPPPTSAANEPKRVKTMVIRQDGGGGSGFDNAAPANAAPPARSGAAPMAIAPSQSNPPPQSNTKVAARTPPAQAAGGAYVVQVSAQRTEAEAQSSYASLQAKYPSVLAGRTANIKRVDLGDKGGVFYRAQVGSFGTSEQAATFCNNLRDLGGQCIVQKN